MKSIFLASLYFLCFSGCSKHEEIYLNEETVDLLVLRTTLEDDAGYEVSGTYPEAPFICKVCFIILSPEEFKDREIIIPILAGTEGDLFEKERFEIQLSESFLKSGLTTKETNSDGTETYTCIEGFGFEGINHQGANKTVGQITGTARQ